MSGNKIVSKKYAYYNEHDPNAAEWLRELIKLDQIAPGEVDTRSIVDVHSDELKSFNQIHLFGGIGVWSYALRQAGWSDDRPIITGSCPCQSFSSAGKQLGFDDPRHLWPHMFQIVRELQFRTIIGEQVASSGALAWWDLVASDLESENYAATAIDLTGASIGAPHIRSRLFWVGHSQHNGRDEKLEPRAADEERRLCQSQGSSDADKLVNSSQSQCKSQRESELHESEQFGATSPGKLDIVANSHGDESTLGVTSGSPGGNRSAQWVSTAQGNGSSSTFWDDAEWLPCRDGKYRATHPDIYPNTPAQSSPSAVVDGATTDMGCGSDPSVSDYPTVEEVQNTQKGRIMRLKGYGNAIVAPLAIEFISAVMEII